MKKAVSRIVLALLLINMLTLAFNIKPVRASGTIYIRSDGSVDPPTAPIQRDGDIYTFTDNIYDEIEVERDNIVIDGNGYTIQGTGVGYGFNLEYRTNVTIKKTTIKEFRNGIRLFNSQGNIIAGNNITNNVLDGIWVAYSSSGNNITSNNINENGWHGIEVEVSPNNTIVGNSIFNNSWHGIYLYYSPDSILRDNALTNNRGNLDVYSGGISGFIQNIDTSNSVNGKPIYYLVSQSNIQVPFEVGYVGLINCINISARDLNLGNSGGGVLLVNTNSSWIVNVNGSNGGNGIYLFYSFNNTISDNTLTNPGAAAVYLYYSNYNVLTRNKIIDNDWRGIQLSHSSGNTIIYNVLTSNLYGIDVYESNNNLVHHNNFINNTRQVSVRSSELVNVWDDGYPSGGNYWSDYAGVDFYNGPYQNEIGSDGIGDTPYVIYANNTDRYPLVNKSILGDVNHDVVVDILDAGVVSSHWYPGPPVGPLGYNSVADLNYDGRVDIVDIAIVNANWGRTVL